jgi:hypothetical protein
MKRIATSVLLVFLLTGCAAPVEITPISTPLPTETPMPTSTGIPTEIPSPTVVFIDVNGLKVPDPKASNPELFDLTSPDSPIVQFANAYGVKPEDIGDLTTLPVTGTDGKQFVVLTTGDLSATTDFDESGTPLLMALQGENGEWTWTEATLKLLGEKVGIKIGTSVDGSENYQRSIYQNTVTDNFSLIMPGGSFMLNTFSTWGEGMAHDFTDFANKNNLQLRILSAFNPSGGSEQGLTDNYKTPDEVRTFMKDRIKTLLGFVRKGSKTELVVVHESTIWEDKGISHWVENNMYYRSFGENWPTVAYTLAYQTAQEMGIEVGKDVVFALSDGNFLQNKTKANALFAMLEQTRNQVAQQLGITPDAVKINVLHESEMHADAANIRGWTGIYTPELNEQMIKDVIKQFSTFGDVELSEIDVSGTDDMDVKGQAIASLIEACIQSGCKDVDLYSTLRFKDPENFSVFAPDFSKTKIYYMILKTLLKNL